MCGKPDALPTNKFRYTIGQFQEAVAMNWSEQVVLVTGGTGSFGKKFVELMLREYHPHKLIIFH